MLILLNFVLINYVDISNESFEFFSETLLTLLNLDILKYTEGVSE